MSDKVKFWSLNGQGIIPDYREKEQFGYYSIYSPEYLSFLSFEVKELDFKLGVEIKNGYFAYLKLSYNKNTGLLVMLNNSLESQKCHLKATLLNVMFDPNHKANAMDALFGSRQRITISPKEEIAKLYILKHE
jgi:hypothetical protein